MLNVGAHDRGRSLRTQGDQVALAVGKGVHLLFDDIGVFANAARKQFRALHDRNTDFFEPEIFKQRTSRAFDLLPDLDLSRKYVFEPSNQLNHHVSIIGVF